MKSFEFTGKNIEKAIENGLKELNKNREDVDIKILSEGGFFSKAKVQISFEDETDEQIAEDIAKEEMGNICNCGCDNCVGTDNQKCECECDDCDCGEECDCDSCEDNQDDEKCANCSSECGFCDCALENNCEGVDLEKLSQEKPVQEEKTLKKEKIYMTSDEVFDVVNEIFQNIFKALNINGKVMILENDEAYEVKVSGDENIASLIGYRGEALNAYQILINSFLSLKNKSKRILLDVENYRNKREESLKALAIRIAKKVVKTKRSHKFEPMSSFERHVIHEALSDFEGVSTHSEGVEPHRQLVVEPTSKEN